MNTDNFIRKTLVVKQVFSIVLKTATPAHAEGIRRRCLKNFKPVESAQAVVAIEKFTVAVHHRIGAESENKCHDKQRDTA